MIETAPEHGLTASGQRKSYQLSLFGLTLVIAGLRPSHISPAKVNKVSIVIRVVVNQSAQDR